MEISDSSGGGGGDCSLSLPSGFGKRPWLVQAQGTQALSFVDISDRSLHTRAIPDLQGKLCLGCVHDGDWLLMADEITGDSFLFCLSDSSKVSLPPLREPLGHLGACVVLGPSPANRESAVVIASTEEPEESFLLRCHPGDEEWAKLTIQGLHSYILSGNLVNCAGQLYSYTTFGFWGLVALDVIDGGATIQARANLWWERPWDASSHKPYLIESSGDLFLVAVSYHGCHPYNCSFDGVSVHRLDRDRATLRKVEGIGAGRAFLIAGRYGFPCAAVEGVVQGNCVYVVLPGCDCERIYKLCLDDMTISLQTTLPHPTENLRGGFWSVPARIRAEYKESDQSIRRDMEVSVLNNFNNDEEEHTATISPWLDLPIEMLELILSNLSLVDRVRFQSVCKEWSLVSNPVAKAKAWPWLMHCIRQDGECKMFDPLHPMEYALKKVGLFDTDVRQAFRFSKDGWVVVFHGSSDHIFAINPITGDTVELPRLDYWYDFTGMAFSSVPTSPDCIFVGAISSPTGDWVRVWTYRTNREETTDDEGEEEQEMCWDDIAFDTSNALFPVARNNPVYFRGEFYFLGQRGNLAVFHPGNIVWRVLDKPEPIHPNLTVNDEGKEACYLVELTGELIAVFHRSANEPPRVLKLDETNMSWVEIEDIGGGTLFLDYRASMAMPSSEVGHGHGDRIYFPKYSEEGNQAFFYDMKAKKYSPTFYSGKEPMNCVWFVPKLHVDT
ncbi:uncharacterized protein LOC107304732 [Oryza brachyantha]|nr:uncharacterized protein LOC107304732 [Oryza brachyantha]